VNDSGEGLILLALLLFCILPECRLVAGTLFIAFFLLMIYFPRVARELAGRLLLALIVFGLYWFGVWIWSDHQ
jgi:hypothetical protein